MRCLIAAVFSFAALLSIGSGTFAQGVEPGPGPTPGVAPIPSPVPSSPSPSESTTPPIRETGRYHPCPASVGFGNGRSVCLGLDEPRRYVHVARWSRCWGWPLYSNSYSNWAY